MISLRQVYKEYPSKKAATVSAVRGVDLDVPDGQFVVITGRSGSGKTTILNLAAGLTRPTRGEVLADGVDVWTLSDQQQSLLRNQKIGFIFQFPSLLPSLTALENVVLPTMFGPAEKKEDAADRAADLLEQVGLGERMGAYPRQLSAGQQKRIVISRALINSPSILMADEATGDLDEQTEAEIMTLLRQIHAKTHITILMVTHNLDLVRYGTRALEMSNGTIRV
jgi:ABC-type lipoprotein export system ATPase subunit